MPNFREIRFAEKKEEILFSAIDIFVKKGYEKTTVEEIAAELKMTKGGIYHYFNGKEDILFQCSMKAYSVANEVLTKILEKRDLNPKEKLGLAIREHVKLLTQKFVYGALRQQELMSPGNQGLQHDTICAERDKFQQTFLNIFQEGIDDGTFKPVNLKLVGFAILGAVNWVARWYSPDGPFSKEKIAETFANYFINGLER